MDERKVDKDSDVLNNVYVVFDGTNYDKNGICNIIKSRGVSKVIRKSEGVYRIYTTNKFDNGFIPMVTGNGQPNNTNASHTHTLKVNSEMLEDGLEVACVGTRLKKVETETNAPIVPEVG